MRDVFHRLVCRLRFRLARQLFFDACSCIVESDQQPSCGEAKVENGAGAFVVKCQLYKRRRFHLVIGSADQRRTLCPTSLYLRDPTTDDLNSGNQSIRIRAEWRRDHLASHLIYTDARRLNCMICLRMLKLRALEALLEVPGFERDDGKDPYSFLVASDWHEEHGQLRKRRFLRLYECVSFGTQDNQLPLRYS